jgi:hypothetical protein
MQGMMGGAIFVGILIAVNCTLEQRKTHDYTSQFSGVLALECTLIAHEDWLFRASTHGPEHVTEVK